MSSLQPPPVPMRRSPSPAPPSPAPPSPQTSQLSQQAHLLLSIETLDESHDSQRVMLPSSHALNSSGSFANHDDVETVHDEDNGGEDEIEHGDFMTPPRAPARRQTSAVSTIVTSPVTSVRGTPSPLSAADASPVFASAHPPEKIASGMNETIVPSQQASVPLPQIQAQAEPRASAAVTKSTNSSFFVPKNWQLHEPVNIGLYAHQLAVFAGCACLLFGPFSVVWNHFNATALYIDQLNIVTGFYAVAVGVIVLFEELIGLIVIEKSVGHIFEFLGSRYNVRFITYAALSAVLFLSWPTLLPAIMLLFAAVVNRIATACNEHFHQEMVHKEWALPIVWKSLKHFGYQLRYAYFLNEGFWHLWIFIYFSGNAVLFAFILRSWIDTVHSTQAAVDAGTLAQSDTYWLAVAKAFGWLLDLNCAVILVPVCRSLITWLYMISVRDQTLISKLSRLLLALLPLDHALEFHRLLGIFILLCAVGHTLPHFINFALRPDLTLATLNGPWPLVSGGLLWLVLYAMYCATVIQIRKANFRLFFTAHQLYVVFVGLLVVHGTKGLGPNYWKFLLAPASLYLLDLALRMRRGRQPVELISVSFMQNVLCLEMAKIGVFSQPYSVGQYIMLQCPLVSSVEYHPFTISSAPSGSTVTVHIKLSTGKPSAWTYRLAALLSMFRPTVRAADEQDDTFSFRLYRHISGVNDRHMGVTSGPDGRPLLRIDGPYSAPTEHLAEYEGAVIVGAGIGSTPLAAALQQVIHYSWRTSVGRIYPRHASFVWIVPYNELPSFRWLIGMITDAQNAVLQQRKTGAIDASLSFQLHIFVTSPPKPNGRTHSLTLLSPHVYGEPRNYRDGVAARSPQASVMPSVLNPHDLYTTLCTPDKRQETAIFCGNPHAGSTNVSAQDLIKEPDQFLDVCINFGRPSNSDWLMILRSMRQRCPDSNVGVMFCGDPRIGRVISKQCLHENVQNPIAHQFRFHCENF